MVKQLQGRPVSAPARRAVGPGSTIGNGPGALPVALVGADVIVLGTAFVAASMMRMGSDWLALWRIYIPALMPVLVGYATFVIGLLAWAGTYRLRLPAEWRGQVSDLMRTLAVLVAVTLSSLYFFRLEDVSRAFLAMFFTLSAMGFLGARLAVRLVFKTLRARGRQSRHMVIVGAGRRAGDLLRHLTDRPDLGVKVVGYLGAPGELQGQQCLGDVGDLARVLASQVVDEVAVCLPFREWATIDLVSQVCEEQGKLVRIPVDELDRVIGRGRLEHVDNVPVLTLSTGPEETAALFVKRIIDLLGSVAGLVAGAPIFLAIAVTILLAEGRPVFIRQPRVGLPGRPFEVLKFRTMGTDAEQRKVDLLEHNERSGPAFKITNDPRVTHTGRWLRRSSLDELPQLINVLKGDMSLVGPRPPIPAEVELYDLWHRRRLSMKPGITGLWQVTARSEADFDRWVELDLEYVDRWSLWLDLRILVRTFSTVLKMRGS